MVVLEMVNYGKNGSNIRKYKESFLHVLKGGIWNLLAWQKRKFDNRPLLFKENVNNMVKGIVGGGNGKLQWIQTQYFMI